MSAPAKETAWQRRQRRAAMRDAYVRDNGDVCQLCGVGKGEPGLCGAKRQKPLEEDHDHRTNEHRGFICWRSNKWLAGWVTPAWLRGAADYLEGRT